MSKERMVKLYTKLEQFELGKKGPGGLIPAKFGINRETGDVIVEFQGNLADPGLDKEVVSRYAIIPREQVTRIDGERIEGGRVYTPTAERVS